VSQEDRATLLLDSRSMNMIERLIGLASCLRRRRQKRMLLGASGCFLKATDWSS